jgi:hypothetical protein
MSLTTHDSLANGIDASQETLALEHYSSSNEYRVRKANHLPKSQQLLKSRRKPGFETKKVEIRKSKKVEMRNEEGRDAKLRIALPYENREQHSV